MRLIENTDLFLESSCQALSFWVIGVNYGNETLIVLLVNLGSERFSVFELEQGCQNLFPNHKMLNSPEGVQKDIVSLRPRKPSILVQVRLTL